MSMATVKVPPKPLRKDEQDSGMKATIMLIRQKTMCRQVLKNLGSCGGSEVHYSHSLLLSSTVALYSFLLIVSMCVTRRRIVDEEDYVESIWFHPLNKTQTHNWIYVFRDI